MDDRMFDLMTKMYNEMQDMKANMATKEDISRIEKDVSSLKQDVSSLKNDVSFLKQDVSSLKNDVSSIKQEMVRFEDKVDTKLSALFDGYTQNTEQLTRVSEQNKENTKDVDLLKNNFRIVKKAFEQVEL